MEEDKNSENEIIIEVEEKEAVNKADSKKTLKHFLVDWAGWKKDIKKIFFILVIIAIILGVISGIKSWSNTNVTGIRINAGISKINYESYSHIGPDFSFKFPNAFVADNDEEKKYGDSYLGGFRLKGDQRTGCDVRSNPVGINFQKSDQEIHNAVASDLSTHIKDFKEISSLRTKIGGEDAYMIEFSFTDPLGNRTRVSQAITSHQGNSYVFVCGTGEYQYEFFADDFNDFFKSFRWTR
ncbi:MAG: hypothetical protein US57_C0009G0030 [Candidatus Moranbacteria bacterium GW2011_GWC2_37_73]|nr:MAG: hypothetical protein UR95_C0005G0012 [Parcubacteria group bacterium GW2011_GWC1_36_108]KKQ00943.1 MAG: hypothetical protein US09_C0004G0006 [Candidatus Moranbacteria bacterium GW2011_GWD1_36_198]KKQ01438.1 MAG: hypothetical protein US10_C0013G0013 [Candidatus Moranbacteria bacterium GW2011_GWD2_36_198]KKQ39786.1 MAG: hypothetical protein US57_C0009G0030 [Candidatus Moranbacteria bacterium GW2011_GWC2_37_73]HAR99758.1 hypothetical protein [Candidatus Moranbacteria bacterium]